MAEYNLDPGDAYSAREQVLKELEQVEARRLELEAEARQALEDSQRLQAQIEGLGIPAAAVVTLGALAVGRNALQSRQEKQLEEEDPAAAAAADSNDDDGASIFEDSPLGGAFAVSNTGTEDISILLLLLFYHIIGQ